MPVNDNLTYVSLFSSAGVGCFGFQEEGFDCIVTNELLEKRLNIQKYNNKCLYDFGYVLGDIKEDSVKQRIITEIEFWTVNHNIPNVDLMIATPPCQGISVANHKKNEKEQVRNSLVVESIKLIKEVLPNFFVIENVRDFLKTICTDIDGSDKQIKSAINQNLSKYYDITMKIINFKEYGNPSSRTRTLVIGAKKSLNIFSTNLFPEMSAEKTIYETIGHLPSLQEMGEISESDIYHNFKNFDPRMLPWIENLQEGQSAFDNTDPEKIPHRIINGEIVYNKNKNGDKYKRQIWNKVAPCIHTRNDILSSQNTIHPSDNRVFSIRELMLLMSIPENFKWLPEDINYLNSLPTIEKKAILKKSEILIRSSIGDAVPPTIFQQIAKKIKLYTNKTNSQMNKLVKKEVIFPL